MIDGPRILVPFNRRETCSLKEAADVAGRSASTLRNWCEKHYIGRRVGDGHWLVSRPALQMLLDGDVRALDAYLSGDRVGPLVAPYFAALSLLTAINVTEANPAETRTNSASLLPRAS